MERICHHVWPISHAASVGLYSVSRLLPLAAGVFWLHCCVARTPVNLICRFFFSVSNKHPFVDSNLLYQFRMNFRRRRRLMELLNEKSPSSQETHDSPFCLRKQSHDNRKSTSFMSGIQVHCLFDHMYLSFETRYSNNSSLWNAASLANLYLFITKKYVQEEKETQPNCSWAANLNVVKSVL